MNTFLNDKDIAGALRLSSAWVRQQRFKRRHQIDHVLTIDPVMIGSSPRYRYEDFKDWQNSLEAEPVLGGCYD